MMNRVRDWVHSRRTKCIHRLVQEIALCQQKIYEISEQLNDYHTEHDILTYMLHNGETSHDDLIRLIVVSDEITHLPFQQEVYKDNIHMIQKRLRHIKGTDPLLFDECGLYG